MKEPKPPIDWDKVELAMRRGKDGELRDGDMTLLQRAFAREPEEYGRRKRAVDAVAIAEEITKWR